MKKKHDMGNVYLRRNMTLFGAYLVMQNVSGLKYAHGPRDAA